jgi:MinD superfamily P-loop ATPase
MRSKNSKALTSAERDHIETIKNMACSVCEDLGPCDAHHVKQGQHFTVIPLCKECHQGSILGWHGQKRAWKIRKMDELDALAVTIQRLRG